MLEERREAGVRVGLPGREGPQGPVSVEGLCLACQGGGGGGQWFLEASGMALRIATEEVHIFSALCSGKMQLRYSSCRNQN